MTVVLAVTWVAREGESDGVAELLRRVMALSRAKPGCLQYDVHRTPDDPNSFFLFERYTGDAAFAAHEASRHFRELVLEESLPLLAARERTVLAPLV